MSETRKRDAVLLEFWKGDGVHVYDSEAMADEIVRLRNQLYLADQSARSSSAEAARLRAILAALREPSERMMQSALKEYGPGQFVAFHRTRLIDAIHAAVAAAEQEVGRE